MHRDFPSNYYLVASSRLMCVHRNSCGDSRAVVTPFMQDGTYPPRNFATLGPSELRPPFTESYTLLFFFISTGQASDFIPHNNILQNLKFLRNSRHPRFFFHIESFSPEVTKLICRVPSQLFILLPSFPLSYLRKS